MPSLTPGMKPRRLVSDTATSSLAVAYTVPDNYRAEVLFVSICNTDTVARTATLKLGGRTIFSTVDIPWKSSLEWDTGMVLHGGETIQIQADASSKVEFYITGGEGPDS